MESHTDNQLDGERMREWKGYGFSDAHISDAMGVSPSGIRQTGELTKHRPPRYPSCFQMVDSCAAEFAQ